MEGFGEWGPNFRVLGRATPEVLVWKQKGKRAALQVSQDQRQELIFTYGGFAFPYQHLPHGTFHQAGLPEHEPQRPPAQPSRE